MNQGKHLLKFNNTIMIEESEHYSLERLKIKLNSFFHDEIDVIASNNPSRQFLLSKKQISTTNNALNRHRCRLSYEFFNQAFGVLINKYLEQWLQLNESQMQLTRYALRGVKKDLTRFVINNFQKWSSLSLDQMSEIVTLLSSKQQKLKRLIINSPEEWFGLSASKIITKASHLFWDDYHRIKNMPPEMDPSKFNNAKPGFFSDDMFSLNTENVSEKMKITFKGNIILSKISSFFSFIFANEKKTEINDCPKKNIPEKINFKLLGRQPSSFSDDNLLVQRTMVQRKSFFEHQENPYLKRAL